MKDRLDNVVQWYPGHMVRAMRRIAEYLKLIDIVIEVIDARAVRSDANPMLDRLIGDRARIVALSRDDLADPATTKAWIEHLASRGREAMAVEARAQQSVSRILAALTAKAKERSGISRVIVVGVPNSGKSSIINGLLKRGAAKTEDRAGVTRQLQWFRLAPTVELMDTPGILVPKIESAQAQWKLALIGAVPRERYDPYEVAVEFHRWLDQRSGRAHEGTRSWRASRRCAASYGAAARSTSTTPHKPTSRPSTTEFLAASVSKLPATVTNKQRKQKNAYERERRRLVRLHRFERAARERGFQLIGGVDEVGRGPLAGPVVAACVVAGEPLMLRGLNDSKVVPPPRRRELAQEIMACVAGYGHRRCERRGDRPPQHLLGKRARDGACDRGAGVRTAAVPLHRRRPHPIVRGPARAA